MPMKDRAATAIIRRFVSARLPIRTTACRTIASTAAFRPMNAAVTGPTLP